MDIQVFVDQSLSAMVLISIWISIDFYGYPRTCCGLSVRGTFDAWVKISVAKTTKSLSLMRLNEMYWTCYWPGVYRDIFTAASYKAVCNAVCWWCYRSNVNFSWLKPAGHKCSEDASKDVSRPQFSKGGQFARNAQDNRRKTWLAIYFVPVFPARSAAAVCRAFAPFFPALHLAKKLSHCDVSCPRIIVLARDSFHRFSSSGSLRFLMHAPSLSLSLSLSVCPFFFPVFLHLRFDLSKMWEGRGWKIGFQFWRLLMVNLP